MNSNKQLKVCSCSNANDKVKQPSSVGKADEEEEEA